MWEPFSRRWTSRIPPDSRSFTVPGTYNPNVGYRFRVLALNTVGYGLGFPSMTAQSMTGEVTVGTAPLAPTNLTLTLLAGPQIRLTWRDNAINESGFTIWRSNDGVNFTQIATAPARNSTGNTSWTDTTVPPPTANANLLVSSARGKSCRFLEPLEHCLHTRACSDRAYSAKQPGWQRSSPARRSA